MKSKKYIYLWAKKGRNINKEYMWLPLYLHLKDTACVASFLWEHWVSDGVKACIIDSIYLDNLENFNKEDIAKNLLIFLALSHDIGKATPIFQLKPSFNKDFDLDKAIVENLSKAGFKDLAEYNISNVENIHHTITGALILQKNGINNCVSSIITAHHGNPKTFNNSIDIIYPSSFYQSEEENSDIYKDWKKLQNEILKNALKESNLDDLKQLPLIAKQGQVLLSGILIIADWIASNEDYFPLIDLDQIEDNSNRAEKGLIKWFTEKTENWTPSSIDIDNIYQERFILSNHLKFIPRDAQAKITDLIEDTSDPGIAIIEAPMGIGKTEIALVAAEQMAVKTGRNGIFFALPTQATSNGIFPRIEKWLENLKDDYSNIRALRLMHGKAYLNKDFTNLSKTIDVKTYEQDDDKNFVSVNDYFNGRRLRILDDFIVGTIDQILLASLKQKHLMLIHLGLANKVVIIDEVHAYDAYMSTYLYETVRWLGAYNVPVIILSATLPIEKRNKLVKEYSLGKYKKFKDLKKPDNFINNYSYPLLTYTDNGEIKQFDNFNKDKIKKKEIEIKKIKTKDFDQLFDILKKQKEYGGVIGVFVNTVRKAQEVESVLTSIFNREDVLLIHSQFIDTDRYKKENTLLKEIGKGNEPNKPNALRPKFKIVVGTQVMEQSLDIDFDMIFTELAPMDLMIQRMGRLYRHDINKRPRNIKAPTAYILNIGDYDFDKGTTYVYDKYILFRTEFYVPDKITIPNDVSKLVQAVYGNDDININNNLKSIYTEYKDKYEIKIKSKEEKAKTFRLKSPETKISDNNNLYNIIDRENINTTSDIKAYAQVRDSSESLEVICLQESKEGYKIFGDTKNITSFKKEAINIAKQTIRLPQGILYGQNIDDMINVLESYYLKNFKEWDNIPILKNNICLVFDENGDYIFKDYVLHYDAFYGLSYEKIENK